MVGGEKAAKNKMTAVRQFAKAFRDGAVQKPRAPEHGLEENFSRFQTEEDWDPDAAFRPMLTPYYSTRPDGNSGKVEGDVGTGL